MGIIEEKAKEYYNGFIENELIKKPIASEFEMTELLYKLNFQLIEDYKKSFKCEDEKEKALIINNVLLQSDYHRSANKYLEKGILEIAEYYFIQGFKANTELWEQLKRLLDNKSL